MTQYELINPSDPVTFLADDFEVATLATILIGGGQYAAEPEDDGEKVPLFMFGGFEPWVEKQFGRKLEGDDAVKVWLNEKRPAVAACLRSFCYGLGSDRKLYDDALAAITEPEKRAEFVAKWNDAKRSSMNNIMGRAHAIADRLEDNDA